jgi:pSer/pThr/pTyr-binding forkhead associated (FHA) protein
LHFTQQEFNMLEVTLENLWLEPLLAREAERVVKIDHFPFMIGRDPTCDYCVDHQYVSRRHCRFALRGDKLWVHDLASLNGTYVNGRRVWNCHPAHDGDLVSLCFHLFRVRISAHLYVAEATPGAASDGEREEAVLAEPQPATIPASQQIDFDEQLTEACHS